MNNMQPCVLSIHLMHPQMYDMTFGSCAHYTLYFPAIEREQWWLLKKILGFSFDEKEHHGYNMLNWESLVDESSNLKNKAISFNSLKEIAPQSNQLKLQSKILFQNVDHNIEHLMGWCVDDVNSATENSATEVWHNRSVHSIGFFAKTKSYIMNEDGIEGTTFGTPNKQRIQSYWQQLLSMERVPEMPLDWFIQKGILNDNQKIEYLNSKHTDDDFSYDQIEKYFIEKGHRLATISNAFEHFEKQLAIPLLDNLQKIYPWKNWNAQSVCIKSVGQRIYWGNTFCHPIQENSAFALQFIKNQHAYWESIHLKKQLSPTENLPPIHSKMGSRL